MLDQNDFDEIKDIKSKEVFDIDVKIYYAVPVQKKISYAECRELLECCICLEPVENDTFTMKCCSQKIHKSCIKKWIMAGDNYEYSDTSLCPLCNAEFNHVDILSSPSFFTRIKNLICDCESRK